MSGQPGAGQKRNPPMKMKINDFKNKAKEKLFSIKLSSALIFLIFLFSSLAFAIPNSMTLQGKLTTSSGASVSGTNNFTFAIYSNATNGNKLWELANKNVTTDANGVYDVILPGINLSFADQYYLGITVGTDNESTPRVNLTSSPYSFRANVSEDLNANNSYTIKDLNVTSTFAANNTLFVGNSFVGIGTASPNIKLEVNVTSPNNGIATNGTLYTPIINTTGNNLTISSASGSVIIRLG